MPTLYTLTCKHCNHDFTVLPRSKKRKFCGENCFKESIRNHDILDNCMVCGTSLNRRLQKKFCSKSCSTTYNNSIRSNESRKKQSQSLKKTLVASGKNRTDLKEKYYAECSFKQWPKKVWENISGYELISKLGMFHPVNNPQGAVRDHIVSKNYGWKNSIDPDVISHPANCQIIDNYANIKKGARTDLSIPILLERIENWKLNFGATGGT